MSDPGSHRRPAIAAQALHFAYGDRAVLRGVELEVEPGEVIGLLGANGSGKTTLLRTLSGLLAPTRGRVSMFGIQPRRLSAPARARLLAVVPQQYSLPAGFRVREVVAMGRSPHLGWLRSPSVEDRRVVDEVMERTDLAGLAERPAHELSGGERQRVVLAMALAQRSRVLLLDEPTAHLDVSHQVGIMRLVLAERQARGVTVIAVLHDMNLAARLCDRLVLLRGGRVLASGTAGAVLVEDVLRECFSADLNVLSDGRGLPVVVPVVSGVSNVSVEDFEETAAADAADFPLSNR